MLCSPTWLSFSFYLQRIRLNQVGIFLSNRKKTKQKLKIASECIMGFVISLHIVPSLQVSPNCCIRLVCISSNSITLSSVTAQWCSLKKSKISYWGYSTDWLSQQCPKRCKFKAFPSDRVKKTSLQIPTSCLSYITAIKWDMMFIHKLDSGKSHLCLGFLTGLGLCVWVTSEFQPEEKYLFPQNRHFWAGMTN